MPTEISWGPLMPQIITAVAAIGGGFVSGWIALKVAKQNNESLEKRQEKEQVHKMGQLNFELGEKRYHAQYQKKLELFTEIMSLCSLDLLQDYQDYENLKGALHLSEEKKKAFQGRSVQIGNVLSAIKLCCSEETHAAAQELAMVFVKSFYNAENVILAIKMYKYSDAVDNFSAAARADLGANPFVRPLSS